MNLPVMRDDRRPSPQAMWRQFVELLIDHEMAVGIETEVPTGRLIAGGETLTRRLPGLAVLPADATAASVTDVLGAARQHERALPRIVYPAGNVTAPAGHLAIEATLLRLDAAPETLPAVPGGILILPIRAARAAYELWCAERFIDDPAAAVLPRHMDDAQYEAVVALRGRTAVGVAALQSRGQTGLVCDVFVRTGEQSEGLADLLVGRMIELAARSQLSDVYAVATNNVDAAMLARNGFAHAMPFGLLVPNPGMAEKAFG